MAESKEAKVVEVTESLEDVFVKVTISKDGAMSINSNVSEIAMMSIISGAITVVADGMLQKQDEPNEPVQ